MNARRLSHSLFAGITALMLALPATAQEVEPDKIQLKNGNTLTGTVTTMKDGKITLSSPLIGDIVVPIDAIDTMSTAAPVTLKTSEGEVVKRRITGLSNGEIQLAGGAQGGPAAPSISIANLAAINPPPKKPEQWTGSVNIGASLSEGNTNRRAVNAAAEASRRTEIDRVTAKAAWAYADEKSSGTRNLTQRRLEGSLKYDYFLSEKAYLLATAGAMGDTPADIDIRFDAGAGVGYQWIEEDHLKLATEAGVSYFTQRFRSMAPSIDTVAARLAYALNWQINDGVQFLQDVEYLQGLEQSEDAYVTKDSRLRMSLTEAMFAQGQWILDYNNTPSPGLERVDHQFLLSVGWSF